MDKIKKNKDSVGLFAYGETGFSALKGLIDAFDVKWVILPKNKSKDQQDSSFVEKLANKNGIFIKKSDSFDEIYQLILETKPNVVIISSYNKIIPEKVLSLTKFINIHHGDLPKWRGRANINWAIINGRKEIGLTFHEAISDLDSGNIYKQIKVLITMQDTVKTVYDKFNNSIEENISEVVKKVIKGLRGLPQKGEGTYCCTRLPEDGYIDWSKSSLEIYNLIRAVTKPYSGAFSYFEGRKMIIWNSEIPANPKKYEGRIHGRIVQIHKDYGVEVLTGDSTIIIKNVKYEGQNVNASDVIKSVKKTLGINFCDLYEKLNLHFEEKEK